MSDYLLLILEDERAHALQAPRAIAELIAKRAQFAEELRRAGTLRDSGRFRPSREGKRVRGRAVEDIAGDHTLGAYYWLDAPSLDDAERVARRVPRLASDQIEVRPLMKGVAVADKDRKPGKVFGFAVLGAAASEAAWTQVMDRIDAETHGGLPGPAFAGGNRLQVPSAGRRVGRAMLDGPFLESKEVIGGVFFLRMLTIEDAIRWAAETRFVVHGALEIRELWRS